MMNDNIWYPFTNMKTASPPLKVLRAKGSTLYLEGDKELIDAISSWWVNLHGHAHSHIAQAIARQALELEHVIFSGFTHEPAQKLVAGILGQVDYMQKAFFSDNGSTAVEVALKMALQFWHNRGEVKRTRIIALENSYHGDTFGAMSVGGRSPFNQAFEKLLFEVDFIPAPNEHNISALENQVKHLCESNEVAAFIYEPLVQGSGGMLMHEPAYLDRLISAVKSQGVLLIADEVMTGFGRTGTFLASDQMNEKPDIVCLSKGITGGFMPLGLTLCKTGVYEAFYTDDRMKTFFHGHSYTGNPLACAAAVASLELLLEESCQQAIDTICKQQALFAARLINHEETKDVRVRGTILAVELNVGETSYFNDFRQKIYEFCLSQGVLLRPLGNVVYILPPYCITQEELQKVHHTIEELCNRITIWKQ